MGKSCKSFSRKKKIKIFLCELNTTETVTWPSKAKENRNSYKKFLTINFVLFNDKMLVIKDRNYFNRRFLVRIWNMLIKKY